jgi:ArsR family transcriptional regulator
MTKPYQTQTKLYKILSHPTRLAILDILRDGEQCVCHMEAILGLRQAHISQHLMALREADLVTDRRDGWNIFYQVIHPEIYTIVDAMNSFSGAESIDYTQIAAAQPHRKACPCPKCNQEVEPTCCDPVETGIVSA